MSQDELIELQALMPEGYIELVVPRPLARRQHYSERVRAVRLVDGGLCWEGPGEGHAFDPCSLAQPTWCDLCGEFIWGLYKQSLRCTLCRFTCHYRCRAFIKLDCCWKGGALANQSDLAEDSVEMDTNVDEPTEWRVSELSFTELQQKVREFNAQVNRDLYIVLNKDGSFTGVIKVWIRPKYSVTVPSEGSGARSSYHLPQLDTATPLHISSSTRAHDIVHALLSAFGVRENPGEFALFEHREQSDQVYQRKLEGSERPLLLRICAGPSEKSLSLVLKENRTGEINWEAFTEPELRNFLHILQCEEEEHIRHIVERYVCARDHLQEALASITQPDMTHVSEQRHQGAPRIQKSYKLPYVHSEFQGMNNLTTMNW
ncbi:ras association domain-containing protein 1-like [Brienomyrus brachyistius]|uniref:ras association domain-containing protein 1-like n=1 Tax=Brienomyrus brachyistius TaxID=42636 RepID=UPI0020B37C83|nr:ras association domain-containing protein 1-like [Brienomyrus brachyistius]XP_048879560.1 ras association domain-containing protein 1-like [Brienomyrus brachyistius]XP_048879561.1 ras association domain-containing protein 1-like [Brienomyrus brachyistius]